MGFVCKKKPSQDSAGNQATSQSTSSANAGMAASQDGSQENYENLNPFQKAAQDLKMDLGIIPKDNQYFANLENRQQNSQAALNDNDKDDKPKVDDKPVEEVDDTEDTSEDTTDDTTVLDPVTDTALDTVEEISDVTFDNDANDNITTYFDNTATAAVNTAAGIDTNIASALTTSVGEAEDDAISYMNSGTAANVVNTGGAQGLLAGDDEDEFDPFNRRKTLIGA
jgi:hypothetical protein